MSYSMTETLQYGVSQAQESLAFASTPYVWVCRRIHTFVCPATKFVARAARFPSRQCMQCALNHVLHHLVRENCAVVSRDCARLDERYSERVGSEYPLQAALP